MVHFDRIYSLSSVAEARSVYDEWSKTYDQEISSEAHQYAAPAIAASYVLRCISSSSSSSSSTTSNSSSTTPNTTTIEILDAGCGTGLVGTHLTHLFASSPLSSPLSSTGNSLAIDGADLSPGMLHQSSLTKTYRSLHQVDLSAPPLPFPTGSYDVVVCVGTLTQNHVGPDALDEFVRVARRPGGFVVATVLETIWESGGYKSKVEDLAASGRVSVLGTGLESYRPGAGVRANMVVLQVL